MPQVISFIYEYAIIHKVLANLIGTQNRGKRKNGKNILKKKTTTDLGLGLEIEFSYRGKMLEREQERVPYVKQILAYR